MSGPFTEEEERELTQLLAQLAHEETPIVAEEEQGADDPASLDEEERNRCGAVEDWEGDDAYARDVCVPRRGPI